nr:hypothetical protein [Treponema sp.]
MDVLVPVEKASLVGIRAIVSAEEAKAVLESLSDEIEPVTSDWKLRYQMNLDLLKKEAFRTSRASSAACTTAQRSRISSKIRKTTRTKLLS